MPPVASETCGPAVWEAAHPATGLRGVVAAIVGSCWRPEGGAALGVDCQSGVLDGIVGGARQSRPGRGWELAAPPL